MSTKSSKSEKLESITSLNKKLEDIFKALHRLTIVLALPKAIPRSNWLIYLGDKEVFSANVSCV